MACAVKHENRAAQLPRQPLPRLTCVVLRRCDDLRLLRKTDGADQRDHQQRQQHGGQGNDDQQLDQREAFAVLGVCVL